MQAGHDPSRRPEWVRLRRLLALAARTDRTRRERTRAARLAAAVAERLGLLRRPTRCQGCGLPRPLTRHHPDHGWPLVVLFLCRGCHDAADGRAPRAAG